MTYAIANQSLVFPTLTSICKLIGSFFTAQMLPCSYIEPFHILLMIYTQINIYIYIYIYIYTHIHREKEKEKEREGIINVINILNILKNILKKMNYMHKRIH